MQKGNKTGAIILAAGKGRRLGGPVPKQHMELKGEPMYMASVRAFAAVEGIEEIVVVSDAAHLEDVRASLEGLHVPQQLTVAEGGAERPDSVIAGLAALGSEIRYALVHDGARPFVTPDLIRRVVQDTCTCGSSVPCVRPKDTVRTAEYTLDRSKLFLVQTPQGFRRDVLVSAYQEAAESGFTGTDDASYVEQLGIRPHLTEGDPWNIKITTPDDLRCCGLLNREEDRRS